MILCHILFVVFFFILCVWHFFHLFELKCARDEEIVRHFVFYHGFLVFIAVLLMCRIYYKKSTGVDCNASECNSVTAKTIENNDTATDNETSINTLIGDTSIGDIDFAEQCNLFDIMLFDFTCLVLN